MKSKHWSILICLSYIAAFTLLVSIMAIANKKWGFDWQNGEIIGGEVLFREYKTRYIGQKSVPYTAYILGGSKAGFLQTATFNSYSNERFYNFFSSVGVFSNYERYSDYIIKQQKGSVKEIVLHLSTYETNLYNDEIYIPIAMQKNIFGAIKSYSLFFKEKYLNSGFFRGLQAFNKTKQPQTVKRDGEGVTSVQKLQKEKDEEKYIRMNVLSSFYLGIKNLFSNETQLQFCKKNIKTLQQMKTLCDENNVKLTVVIGAHFIGVLGDIYGQDFDDYLRDLVSVAGEVWNFCGINDVNMNPYNFYNDGHFWEFTGDKMIQTMYSPTPNTTDLDAFGILLTADNIESYIARQHEKWLALKAEYEATGTIALQGKDDASYLEK